MIKLIGGLFGGMLATLVLLHFAALSIPRPTPEVRWIEQRIQIKSALAQSDRKPGLLLVGGSSTLFGLSAREIQAAYGIPCINLGTHAGLGRRYILNFARNLVRPGDVVVLALEYELYGREKYDRALNHYLVARDHEYYLSLPWASKIQVLANITPLEWFGFIEQRITRREWPARGYQLDALNGFGDETGNRKEAVDARVIATLSGTRPGLFRMDPDALQDLGDFSAHVRTAGATLVLAYPNLLDLAFDREANRNFFRALSGAAEAAGITVVGRPEDNLFVLADAFDTVYHPIDMVQAQKSHALVTQLRAANVTLPR